MRGAPAATAHHPEQHAFAQTTVGDGDFGDRPGGSDGFEYGAARQHERRAFRPDARVAHQAVAAEGA